MYGATKWPKSKISIPYFIGSKQTGSNNVPEKLPWVLKSKELLTIAEIVDHMIYFRLVWNRLKDSRIRRMKSIWIQKCSRLPSELNPFMSGNSNNFHFRMKTRVLNKNRVVIGKALPVKVSYQFSQITKHVFHSIFSRKRPRSRNQKMAVGWQHQKAKARWKNHLNTRGKWMLINDFVQFKLEATVFFLAFI